MSAAAPVAMVATLLRHAAMTALPVRTASASLVHTAALCAAKLVVMELANTTFAIIALTVKSCVMGNVVKENVSTIPVSQLTGSSKPSAVASDGFRLCSSWSSEDFYGGRFLCRCFFPKVWISVFLWLSRMQSL